MKEDDSAQIAAELASLLRYDATVLLAFIRSLSVDGDVSKETIALLLGVDEIKSERLLEKMLADGLIIRAGGNNLYLPLHPRLALSNLYRLALARDEKVRAGRVRLDAITALLAKRREEVQRW